MQIFKPRPLALFYTSSCIQLVLFLLLRVEPALPAGCCNRGEGEIAPSRQKRMVPETADSAATNHADKKPAPKKGGAGIDKATFMREVGQLDDKYKQFLRQTILKTFRLEEAPERQAAEDWRRHSDLDSIRMGNPEDDGPSSGSNQRDRPQNDAGVDELRRDVGDEEGEEPTATPRRYTVNVVGKRTAVETEDNPSPVRQTRHHRHHNRRHHHKQQNLANRPTVIKACLIEHHFNVALLAGQKADQDVDTIVDKAEFVLLLRNRHRVNDYSNPAANAKFEKNTASSNVEGDLQSGDNLQYGALHRADQFLFQGVDLLWSSDASNDTGDDVSGVNARPGVRGRPNGRNLNRQQPTKTVDVTFLFEPFWTVARGANVTATSVVRYEESEMDQSPSFCEGLRPAAPVLRLQLREVAKQRENYLKSKRHSDHKETSETGDPRTDAPAGRSKRRRNGGVLDCETQWDSAFFNSINDSFYDQLMPCCRRKIRINFTELGWDSWVVSPRSFDAYYCIGRCSSFGNGDPDRAAGHHAVPLADDPRHRAPPSTRSADDPRRHYHEPIDGSALYAEMMNGRRATNAGVAGGGALSLAPCCTPTKYAPLSLRVLTGVNEEVTQVLDNLIVKRCGCM